MAEVVLSEDNKIEIPQEAREALGLKPGDKLVVVVHSNDLIVFERPASYMEALRGIVPYPPDYLEKERQDWG